MSGFQGSTSLKYYKRLGIYKNSTGTVSFDPKTNIGRSYRWTFCAHVNGVVVFNDYNWSTTTSGHQSAVRGVLRDLKIKYVEGDFGDTDVDTLGASATRKLYTQLVALEIKAESVVGLKRAESRVNRHRLWQIADIKKDLEKLESLNKTFKIGKKEMLAIRADAEQVELDRISDIESKKCFKALELKRAAQDLNLIQL